MLLGPAAFVRTRLRSTAKGRRCKPRSFSSYETPLIEAVLQPALAKEVPTQTRERPSGEASTGGANRTQFLRASASQQTQYGILRRGSHAKNKIVIGDPEHSRP